MLHHGHFTNAVTHGLHDSSICYLPWQGFDQYQDKLGHAYRELVPRSNRRSIDVVSGVPGDIALQEGNPVLALGGLCGGGAIGSHGATGGHLLSLGHHRTLLISGGDLF